MRQQIEVPGDDARRRIADHHPGRPQFVYHHVVTLVQKRDRGKAHLAQAVGRHAHRPAGQADLCAQANVPLMLDPAPARELPAELYGKLAWITPNETEAAFYLGHAVPDNGTEDAAQALLKKGTKGVLLKLGNRGSYFAQTNGSEVKIQAFHVNAIDTTAAGDCFNGAFAAALMLGQSRLEAAMFASAASAISNSS